MKCIEEDQPGKGADVTAPYLDVPKVGSIQVNQDLKFQSRQWTVQRVGWAVMALVVLAAVVGVFGNGPLANATARSSDGAYQVEYARFARHRAPTSIRVVLQQGAVGSEARIAIDRGYADGMQVEQVYPEPESVEVGGNEVVYTFKLAAEGTATTVDFSALYEDMGRNGGTIALEVHPPVRLSQFVYP